MFFVQAEDGIRDLVRSRGLGDVYKSQGFQSPEDGADQLRSGASGDPCGSDGEQNGGHSSFAQYRQPHAGHRRVYPRPVSYTHLRAHENVLDVVCRLLLEKKKIT